MKRNFAKILTLLLVLVMAVSMAVFSASATSHSLLDGNVTVSDSANSSSVSDGVVTITAKGSIISKKTNNVTIYNNLTERARLTFSWSASTYNSFTDPNGSSAASGEYSGILEAGASVTLSIKSNSGLSNTTATLVLSGFSLNAIADAANVTFNFDSTMGTVTADGVAVTPDTPISINPETGVAVTATAASGYQFVAWVDANNTLLSTSPSVTLPITADATVKPVFNANLACFTVQNNSIDYLYEDLNTAITAAQNSTSKVVVLACNGTLAAGEYTIPSGVTLLIPFDADNTLYTTEPVAEIGYVTPTFFRALTMADGAVLNVEGSLSLSGKVSADMGSNGSPKGPTSRIIMKSGSKISLKNGSNLYAWGYITGSGSVDALSGSHVYECFQVTDYRGGTATTGIVGESEYRVFPMSQYYIQNVEVPMALHAGATEEAFMSISYKFISADRTIVSTSIPFVGTDGAMFQIQDGYVIKDYLESRGRLSVQTYGDVSISAIEMSMQLSAITGNTTIDSKDYDLPITNHFTIEAISGNVYVEQSLVMYPGSELYIREGAAGVVASGSRVVVYALEDWVNESVYYGISTTATAKGYRQLKFVPGGDSTEGRLKDALVQIDGTVDVTGGSIYSTASEGNIFSTGSGVLKTSAPTEATAYYVTQDDPADDSARTYMELAIRPAMLKNADGSYVGTTTADTYTYDAATGMWNAPTHTYSEFNEAATCTTDGRVGTQCDVCDHEIVTQIIPAAHTTVVDAAVAPTCTETGLTEGSHCSVCGETLVAQTVVNALGHTEVIDKAVAATCTETGLTEGSHCSVCGTTIVVQEILESLDHNGVVDAAVDATCTATGLTEGMHCDRCGEVLIAQNVIDALGHTEVADEAVAATCTTSGLTAGSHCELCSETIVAQEIVDALGHTEVIDAAVAATCTATGLTEGKHCDRCGEILIAQEEIKALGHTEVIDAAVAATCTTTGLTEGKHCSVCEETIVAQTVVEALGHSYGDWNVTTEPTYQAAGEQSKTCSVCQDVVTEAVPVLENPVEHWNVVLKEDIGVNFDIALEEDDVLQITVDGKAVEPVLENGLYSVDVAAAQMNDIIAIYVNGLPVTREYSVRSYGDDILKGNYDDKTKELVRYMLVYGGAAQTYFGYNNETAADLASNGITVEAQEPADTQDMSVSGKVEGIRFYGASLLHKDKTGVRIYFTGDITKLTVTVEGKDFVAGVTADGKSYVEVNGINPQELGNAVKVSVSDGTAAIEVSYSPLNYIVRSYNKTNASAELKALVQAMYGYYQAALAYQAN